MPWSLLFLFQENDMALVTDRVAMTGSEISYTIPANTAYIAFHALDGDITIASASSGDAWTLKQGQKEGHPGKDLSGQTVYLSGTNAVILEVLTRTGTIG
jgi:hypothetical protein